MSIMRALWLLSLGLIISAEAQAKVIHYGFAGGINWTQLSAVDSAPSPTFLRSVSLSNVSYSGAVSLSFFQEYLLGFDLAGDYANVALSSGTDTWNAQSFIGSVMGTINFNLFKKRHKLGFGYFSGINQSKSTSLGLVVIPDRFEGFAFEGKDFFSAGKAEGWFLIARVFVRNNPSSGAVGAFSQVILNGLIGYDF